MHSSWSLWVTALSPLLLLLTATGPTSALTEDEKQTMVALHNFYRAQVSPPASDMLQMVSVTEGPASWDWRGSGCSLQPFASPHSSWGCSQTPSSGQRQSP